MSLLEFSSIVLFVNGDGIHNNGTRDIQVVNLDHGSGQCENLKKHPLALKNAAGAFIDEKLIICGGGSGIKLGKYVSTPNPKHYSIKGMSKVYEKSLLTLCTQLRSP